MQHRTATKTKSSEIFRFENESVVSFTSVHGGQGIGGSKTATNVHSSGNTDSMNQPERISQETTLLLPQKELSASHIITQRVKQ